MEKSCKEWLKRDIFCWNTGFRLKSFVSDLSARSDSSTCLKLKKLNEKDERQTWTEKYLFLYEDILLSIIDSRVSKQEKNKNQQKEKLSSASSDYIQLFTPLSN